jgi:hypothetical protein
MTKLKLYGNIAIGTRKGKNIKDKLKFTEKITLSRFA